MKKFIIISGSILLVLLIAIIVLPIVFNDRIVAVVKKEINNNLNAKADFTDFDLSLIRSFPDFSLSLNNFTIIGINEFNGDTLTHIEELSATVDLMSVIKGEQISIESVSLLKPFVNLLVLKDGKANWDISKDTSAAETGEPSEFKASLKKYRIDKGLIIYTDLSSDMSMSLADFNHKGNGDFTQDLFTLNTKTEIGSADFWYGGVKYLHKAVADLKADLDMDMKNMKFTFKENELVLNGLGLGFGGWIAMPADDITMDLVFNAKQNEFRNFLSLVPGIYNDQFKDLTAAGTLAFKGFVKGTYNEKQLPGYGLTLQIKDGMFKYPSLPSSVKNVQVDLAINNPDGVTDHVAIDLNKLHIEMGQEPFDARLKVRTPVSNADLDGMIKGRVNLANIDKMVPLEKGTTLKGLLVADVSFKGRMSSIEQKNFEAFHAAGNLALTDLNYSTTDYKQSFILSVLNVTFNPRNVTLNKLEARMGKSDFNATGSVDNAFAYFLKDEMLSGSLNLNSTQIDLNEFTSDEQSATGDTSAGKLITVPSGIDFTLNTNIAKLIYDNVVLTNVKGSAAIRNSTVYLNNLAFLTLGGNVVMTGSYAAPTEKEADMKLSLQVNNCDIQQTVKTFNTVKKMAPIAERCNGRFTSSFTMNGKLNSAMEPVMNSLNGNGKLQTHAVSISNFKPLVKVAETLKMDQFKQVNPSDLNLSFEFLSGRVYVKPFETTLAGYKTKIEGSNGFDQTIDYAMQVSLPTSKLPGAATNVISGLISEANSKGANLSMGENVNVNVMLGGTIDDPVVKTGLKESTGAIVDDLKEKAREELEKKKKELEDKGKAEAERLKSEAEQKAKAEADRIKQEAEAKIKAEQERLKKEAEQKGKDALKDLFGNPKK